MKNFFKKLAFVLALALVVTAIAPASKASAATAPTLKKSSKVLYIGGDKTGNIGDTYRFTFNNAAGYTATWKSTKKTVATVDAKTGNIQAVGVGSSDIKATLTNKAGKAVELVAKVYVKQNATAIGFGSKAAVKEALAVGDTAKVNVYRAVGATKVWKQTDKSLSTDVIKWTSSKPEVATVDKWGKVTAVAAGTTTITATATQSEGSTPVLSKSYDVTVAAGLKSVAQKSVNTFEAIFAGDLSTIANKDNVKVYTLVGTTKVSVLVKEVKFDAVDKTKATVTTYTDLVKDAEYVVEYNDTTASFKGADLSDKAVAKLEIKTTEAVKSVETTIDVKAYDKNGVEIPASVIAGRITLSAETGDFFLDSANKKITFYNSGKTATVKAVFHTYEYGTDYKEVTIDAVGVITSVEKATIVVKSVDAFTAYDKTKTPDFDKANSTISVSDNGTYDVAVKVTLSADNKVVKSTDADQATKFKFESSNESVLLVNGTTLYPIKEGGAVVIVKYNDTVVGAYTVTIAPKRVASVLIADLDKNLLSQGNADDSVKLTVKVNDQYGVERTSSETISVSFISGPTGGYTGVPAAVAGKTNEFVFNGTDYTVKGTYRFEVKVGALVKHVIFTVDKADAAASYQLTGVGKTVDTALKVGTFGDTANTDSKTFEIKLASYATNGYKYKNMAITATGTSTSVYADGTVFAEVTAPSGKTAADIAKFYSVTGGAVEFTPVIATVSGGSVVFEKAPAGVYNVKVFEMVVGKAVARSGGNFIINDTPVKVEVTVKATTAPSSDLVAALKGTDVATIKVEGKDYNAEVYKVDTIGGASADKLYVSKAYVSVYVEYAGQEGRMVVEAPIATTFTVK